MEVGSSSLPGTTHRQDDRYNATLNYGGLAQLARAPALQAGGQRFESVILHVRGGEWKNPLPYLYKIFDILTQARL